MKNIITIILAAAVLLGSNFINAAEDSENILPPVETDASQLSSVEKLYVKTFNLEGNTVFSDEELRAILKDYMNREITAEKLQEAKNQVTGYYITNGYINSGAVIPDQKVEGGEITFRIIEGILSDVTISGNTWLRNNYIQKRVELGTGHGEKPLNINTLQEHLKIIKQDPRIENINAALTPGLELGKANLSLEIQEARPYYVNFRFNNHNSPSIGPYRGEVEIGHMNLTGWGDSLNAQYGLTEGLDDYSVNYTIPITRWDTTLAFNFDRSETVVVEDPFEQLDIKSDTTTYGASLRHPFYKTLATEFAMGFEFEARESETTLLGIGFSFPGSGSDPELGEDTGKTEFNVYRFTQEWSNRSLNQVVAAYSSFNIGDITKGESEEQFFSWLGQFQWLRRIGLWNSQLLFNVNVQLTGDTMVSAEKFAIGGSDTVRGYRENQITTDNGITSSFEWRIPVAQWKIPGISKGANDGFVQVIPFFDFGKGWNTDDPDPDPDNIYSIGIGTRWSVRDNIYAEIFWGYAIEDVDISGEDDIQDDGIHFEIQIGLF